MGVRKHVREVSMRKLAVVLTGLAALTFVGGTARAFYGRIFYGTSLYVLQPETYWRGATGLLLFAIVLLMLERSQPR
jgi:hypothetical protein